jgi:hypothetical protein
MAFRKFESIKLGHPGTRLDDQVRDCVIRCRSFSSRCLESASRQYSNNRTEQNRTEQTSLLITNTSSLDIPLDDLTERLSSGEVPGEQSPISTRYRD